MIDEEKAKDVFEGRTTYLFFGGLGAFVSGLGAGGLRSDGLRALCSKEDHPGCQILLHSLFN